MDHYEERTETTTRKIHTKTTCDCCQREIKNEAYNADEVDVGVVAHTRLVVSVGAQKGQCYPEGAFVNVYKPDICIDCFRSKIIPALVALGINVPWRDVYGDPVAE